MFAASFRRCFARSGKLLLATASVAPITPGDNNEKKEAKEFEQSALRTFVVTPAREFVWNAVDTAKAAQTSFTEGFSNTTHKAANSVDIQQVRDVARSTREFVDQVPGVVTVGAAALLPFILLRKSKVKAFSAAILFGALATTQVYPGLLDTGARRLVETYKQQTGKSD